MEAGLDAVFLARLQFAVTIMFHFIFPPISIGLAWLLVGMEWQGWKKNDEDYLRMALFFQKLFAITFATGVATGIIMEFQFGTNWSEYSKFVGDVFGAPLAAEGVFAFFLESGFVGLYLFGRGRVSKSVHWFSSLMVATGATLSAFWIIVANSWQQTPAGHKIVVVNGVRKAELVNFFDAVFNPSTLWRYFHMIDAAVICGAFFVMGFSAWLLLRGKGGESPKKALRLALIVAFVASLLELAPLGDQHAAQVARTQPAKFAAMEGIYETSEAGTGLLIFGIPTDLDTDNPKMLAKVEIPYMISLLVHMDTKTPIDGLDKYPQDEWPPLLITFASFHIMVALGTFFILFTALGLFLLRGDKLWDKKWFLKFLPWAMLLPHVAIQLGWVTAEVGRQPWLVYGLLRTADGASPTVTAGEILFSIILFSIVYLMLGSLYIFLIFKEAGEFFDHVDDNPHLAEFRQSGETKEVTAKEENKEEKEEEPEKEESENNDAADAAEAKGEA